MSNIMVMMIAALGIELVLVLLALLAFSWFRNRAASRRDDKAIQVLVTRIKNAAGERETTIGRFLSERMGMSGDALAQAKSAMLRAEMVLLQRFAGVYKKRDAGAAAQFDIDLGAALGPYHELRASGEGMRGEPAETDASELEALRAENRRLSDELSVTMETMSRMLNEYSTMFAGGAPGEATPISSLVGAAAAAVVSEDDGGGVDVTLDGEQSEPVSSIPTDHAVGDLEGDHPRDVEGDGDGQDDIDVLFAEDDSEGLFEASAPALPGMTGDDIPGDPAGVGVEETADLIVTAGEGAAGGDSADDGMADEEWEVIIDAPEPSAMEVEQGDDLDHVSELLEEGPVEVMAFEGADEFDPELAEHGDDLFDSAESETVARAEAAPVGRTGSAGAVETADEDALFDAGEEPLKTQSGG